MDIGRIIRKVFGRAGVLAAALAVMAVCAYALPASAMTVYEDPDTGQLFNRPGPGRVKVEGELIMPASTDASARPASHDGEQWYDNFDVWADLRLRYEFRLHEREDTRSTRHRGRYRFRLGATAKVNDQVEFGAELRSGGSARSDNQTFTDNFDKFEVYIAKAYAAWTPMDWITITGGQFDNPLYRPKDLVWDKDINPQGAAIELAKEFGNFEPFLNTGVWIVDQVSNDDPFLVPVQAGTTVKISDNVKAKAAATYYIYSNLKGRAPGPESSGTNSTMGGRLAYDYDAIGASGELSVKLPGPVPALKIFGDYVSNFDPSRNNIGWMGGVKVGSSKIKGLGDWQITYNYRRLEKDAIPDFLPDSDANGGDTGITAHEVEVAFGLGKHVEFKVDGYHAREITSNRDEYLLQADLVFKAK